MANLRAKILLKELELLGLYKQELDEVVKEVEIQEEEMKNLKAVDYSKMPNRFNPKEIERIRLTQSDDLKEIEMEQLELRTVIKIIEKKAEKIPRNSVAYSALIKKEPYADICKRLNIRGRSSLYNIIISDLTKATRRKKEART